MTRLLPILLLTTTLSAQTTQPKKLSAPAQKSYDASRALVAKTTTARGPEFSIDLGHPRRYEASMACVVAAPRMAVKEWIIIGPLPPKLPWQTNLEHTSTPQAQPIEDISPLKRPALLWRIPNDDPNKRITPIAFTFTLDLLPRTLRPVDKSATPPQITPLTPTDLACFTAPGPTTDYDSAAFQSFLTENALRPTEKETDIDFARRAFLFIKSKAVFEFKDKPERRASLVCSNLKTDCGGLTALFVAILRANAIPARQTIGRWATTAKPTDKLDGIEWQQEHIKSEFFAAGVGWVPVDVSVAVAYEKDKSTLAQFGRDDGDFITLHLDPDLQLDTIHHGPQTIPLLQEPNFWTKGQGSMDKSTSKSDWQVQPRRRGR